MAYIRSVARKPCVGIPQYVPGSCDRAGWLTWCDYVEEQYLAGVPSKVLAERTVAADHNVHRVVKSRGLVSHRNRAPTEYPEHLLDGVARLFADDPSCSIEKVRRELGIKSGWTVTKLTDRLGIEIQPYRRTSWVSNRPVVSTKNYYRYQRQARYLTGVMVKKYGDKIQGSEFRHLVDKSLPREVRYELDHKLTIYEGFHRANEPLNLYSLIHPANLCFIPSIENREKSSRSVLSPSQLEVDSATWESVYGKVEYPHYELSAIDAKLRIKERAFTRVHLTATYTVGVPNLINLVLQEDRQFTEWPARGWVRRANVGDLLWMHLRGYKTTEIGVRFGICLDQVATVLKRCGLSTDFPKWKGCDPTNLISKLRYWLDTPAKNSGCRKYEVYSMRGLSTNIAYDGGPLHYLLRGLVVGRQPLPYLSAQIGVSEVQAFVWAVKSLNLLEYDMNKTLNTLMGGGVPW